MAMLSFRAALLIASAFAVRDELTAAGDAVVANKDFDMGSTAIAVRNISDTVFAARDGAYTMVMDVCIGPTMNQDDVGVDAWLKYYERNGDLTQWAPEHYKAGDQMTDKTKNVLASVTDTTNGIKRLVEVMKNGNSFSKHHESPNNGVVFGFGFMFEDESGAVTDEDIMTILAEHRAGMSIENRVNMVLTVGFWTQMEAPFHVCVGICRSFLGTGQHKGMALKLLGFIPAAMNSAASSGLFGMATQRFITRPLEVMAQIASGERGASAITFTQAELNIPSDSTLRLPAPPGSGSDSSTIEAYNQQKIAIWQKGCERKVQALWWLGGMQEDEFTRKQEDDYAAFCHEPDFKIDEAQMAQYAHGHAGVGGPGGQDFFMQFVADIFAPTWGFIGKLVASRS